MEQRSDASPLIPSVLGFDSLALKLIALVTMTIDHIAASGLLGSYGALYYLMRGIGRIAFPIYCFLLVVGFHRTRSRGRYLLRLLLFAIPSEPVFDLMLTGRLYSTAYQSVMLTLAIGLAMLWGMDVCQRRLRQALAARQGLCLTLTWLSQAVLLAACYQLAEWLETDYGGGGVLVIYLFYLYYTFPQRHRLLPAALFSLLFALCLYCCFGAVELPGLLALVPIFLYSETQTTAIRGEDGPTVVFRREKRSPALVKYGFYAYYPVHILVICLLRRCVWGY